MFKTMKLKSKIIASTTLPLILVVILGALCWSGVSSLLDTSHWVKHTFEVIGKAKNIEGSAVDMETGMRGYLLAGKEEFLDPYKSGKTTFDKLVSELKETVNDNPAQVKLLEETEANVNAWITDVVEPAIALRREVGNSKTMDDIANLVGQARGKKYFDKFREQIATFVERETVLLDKRNEEADSTAATAKSIILIGTTLTLLLAIVLSYFSANSITKPINRIIESLASSSHQVTAAAEQVSSSSQSLANGATEQAAGLEESSSSLEEMASMTQQSSGDAQEASRLASESSKTANDGIVAMQKMNSAIQDIQKSSDATAKIIKVIDEIAFQTNLLALNAAVEAARAGEAGKGFAVVAEEVRNLAMRSAEAAKDTSVMIEESVKNSNNGVEIANEVSAVLESIVSGIGKTADLVENIAAASTEQAEGIRQINVSVSQMDRITQENSANSEESASAAEELNAQADEMRNMVEELSFLVGGVSNKNRKSNQLNYSDHAYHQIASGEQSKENDREFNFQA